MSFWDPFGVVDKGMNALGLGSKNNPANSAQKYLDKVPGTIKPYYDPYIQAGQQALPELQEQFQMLMKNPELLMQHLGGAYQQSPGYKFQYDKGMNAIENAAAAGGMTGTPQHQQQAGQMATGLANQDYYNFLDRIMGMYGQGLSGMGGINQQGYDASNELAQSLANTLLSQGNLAYAGKANQNNALGKTLGTIGSLFGGAMGGMV